MERRLIQVENITDQAGITAALRRGFAARPLAAGCNEERTLQELLKRIN